MAPNSKKAKIEEQYCCTVKVFTPVKKPYKGNCILIGDSAAFFQVQIQGALTCGYLAADAVLKELNGQKGFEEYTEKWMNSFEFNQEGMFEESQASGFVPRYEDDEIDYLFSLCEGIILEGNFSQRKTARLVWDTILRDTEKIRKERPEIYKKIASTHAGK